MISIVLPTRDHLGKTMEIFNFDALLKKKVLKRYQIIRLLAHGYLAFENAAKELNLSVSQTKRLLRKFRKAHGSPVAFLPINNSSWNKKDDQVRKEIVKLKRENPSRSNCYIAELVGEKHDSISHGTVRNILIQAGCYKRTKIRRKPYKRFEAEASGALVQMDTCEGYWLKGCPRLYLILMLDDYSRAILAARIVTSDTTWNNMLVIQDMIKKYGLPQIIYTDNDSKFKLIRHRDKRLRYSDPEKYKTEIQRALLELGITHITHRPFSPHCKGKIERLFRFIQKRLLRDHKCKTLEELNRELKNWIDQYNEGHINRITNVAPKDRLKNNVFKPVPKHLLLEDVLCLKNTRTVQKDNSFSFQGQTYFLDRKYHLAYSEIELCIVPEKKIKVFHNGKFIQSFRISR